MSSQKLVFSALILFCLFGGSEMYAAGNSIDLPTALERALRDNAELKAKRYSLGIAQGRAQQAGLLFQSNPRFSIETEYQTSGGSGTSVELNLLQELEIAGQRGYRSEAAAKNLAQARLSIEDAERLVRMEVARAFYNLLAVQQSIRDLNDVLATQDNLLQAGEKRFAREDITVLELNTLRLDREQVRNELANKLLERVTMENDLRRLVGLQEEGSLVAAGDLLEILGRKRNAVPERQNLQACSLANRADLKAAKLAVEVREAELRLAQARRIPNISLGPRYKRDINQNVVGGEIAIPLPFFNRNQEEITTALANQNISKAELEGRTLSVRQQLDSTYTKLTLAKERIEAYGNDYQGDLKKMLALTRKAYESGEMTIFEFSVTRDRFTKARARSLEAALAYVQAIAELDAQAPSCLP
jgi:outer membrane protein, heavy metal efflux system